MDDREYEAVTAALYRALGEGSGLQIVGYGSSCRVQGKSGSWYQIDVLAEQSNGLQTVRTAIECKYWQKKVTRNVISNLVTTIEDTDIEKGVIVSKEGFTSGAVALARQKNISLVEMRKPNEADWEGRVKTIHIALNFKTFEFYDVEFMQPPPAAGQTVKTVSIPNVPSNKVMVKEPGQAAITFDSIVKTNAGPVSESDSPIKVKFPTGTTLQVVGFEELARIDGVSYKVRCHTLKKELVVNGEELIQLIVKEVFEGRRYSVDRDGMVRETTDL